MGISIRTYSQSVSYFAIITTAITPIKRVSTVIASHLTESTHTRSMYIATDTIEHTNTLSNE